MLSLMFLAMQNAHRETVDMSLSAFVSVLRPEFQVPEVGCHKSSPLRRDLKRTQSQRVHQVFCLT